MRHFIVREEGGLYELLSKRSWQRKRRSVPIWGYLKDGHVYVFDTIIKAKFGVFPWRSHDQRVTPDGL